MVALRWRRIATGASSVAGSAGWKALVRLETGAVGSTCTFEGRLVKVTGSGTLWAWCRDGCGFIVGAEVLAAAAVCEAAAGGTIAAEDLTVLNVGLLAAGVLTTPSWME